MFLIVKSLDNPVLILFLWLLLFFALDYFIIWYLELNTNQIAWQECHELNIEMVKIDKEHNEKMVKEEKKWRLLYGYKDDLVTTGNN